MVESCTKQFANAKDNPWHTSFNFLAKLPSLRVRSAEDPFEWGIFDTVLAIIDLGQLMSQVESVANARVKPEAAARWERMCSVTCEIDRLAWLMESICYHCFHSP